MHNLYSEKWSVAAILYAYAGTVLWLLGWVKPIISIPIVCLLGIVIYQFWEEEKNNINTEKRTATITWGLLIFVGIASFLWVLLSGSGGICLQQADWEKHNFILNDLITRNWPVYYHNSSDDAMLTYYIGQYLVPATVGKLFNSFRIGEIAMLFWNSFGISLVMLLVFRTTKADTTRKQIFAVLAFIFFGCALFLGRGIYAATPFGSGDICKNESWLSASIYVRYRHLVNLLRCIPTNAITPWLAVALFEEHHTSPKYYLLFATPLALHATFPFLGLAILMVAIFVAKLSLPSTSKSERFCALKECVGVPNLCVFPALLVTLIYIWGNVAGEKPTNIGFSIIDYGANSTFYFCFCLTFLCYSIILFDTYKNNLLFYAVNAALLVFPFFRMGLYNDLCMNASIPAIFLLMIFTIRGVFLLSAQESSRKQVVALVLLLAIGAIYPARQLVGLWQAGFAWDGTNRRNGTTQSHGIGSMNEFARRDGTVPADYAYNYYTYDYEQSVFYLWFAKNR